MQLEVSTSYIVLDSIIYNTTIQTVRNLTVNVLSRGDAVAVCAIKKKFAPGLHKVAFILILCLYLYHLFSVEMSTMSGRRVQLEGCNRFILSGHGYRGLFACAGGCQTTVYGGIIKGLTLTEIANKNHTTLSPRKSRGVSTRRVSLVIRLRLLSADLKNGTTTNTETQTITAKKHSA